MFKGQFIDYLKTPIRDNPLGYKATHHLNMKQVKNVVEHTTMTF